MIEMDKRREAAKRAVLNHAATWLTRITSENLVRIDDVRSGHPQTRKYDNSGRNRDTLDRSVGYVIEPGTRDGRDEQHGWLHLVRSALPFGHGKVPITHCVEDMRDVLDDEIDYFLELGIDPRLVADYRRQLHEFFGTLFHAQTGYLDNQAFEAELQRLVTELTAAREALATAADHASTTDAGEHQILAKLDNLRRGVAKCHRNEREILWCVSEEKERFENDDGRKLDSIKEAAVYLACTRIRSAPQGDQNAIANKVFNDFKTLPGFYSDYRTFMRQVYRSLKRFAT